MRGNAMKEYIIRGYEPEKLFNYFEDISAVPRGSGNERGIADFIEKFAKDRGLFCIRDSLNNVFIRKPATPGYEAQPGIMLQGHTDMVCEKNAGTEHDFLADGLELYIENGWLKAHGTTLGGDDGCAVAAMLYALDSDTLCHPELECLFTTGEETGLYGATGFDYSVVRSKKLINLDSEAEGIATVSCAGGIGLDFSFVPDRIPTPTFCRPLSVEISGLSGGHSGEDIIREKGNAIILLMRTLSALYEIHPFSIVTLSGGGRGNAIPREASAVIFTDEPDNAAEFIKNYSKTLREWLPACDSGMRVRVGKAKGEHGKMLTLADSSRIFNLTSFIPNGVISRIPEKLTMVETSNNLGILSDDGEKILFVYHGRSSLDSKMDVLALTAKRAAKALGFELDINGRYSGWPMKTDSSLAEEFVAAAKTVLGDNAEPRTAAIHAGLECGIICGAVPGLDAISIGPVLKDIHSPGERLDLGSFARMWEIVKIMLETKEG